MGHVEKRSSQRIHVEIPVSLGKGKSVTRDVSWNGIYLITDHPYAEGEEFSYALNFTYALPRKKIKLAFDGEVIRVDQHSGKFGIAAKTNNIRYFNETLQRSGHNLFSRL